MAPETRACVYCDADAPAAARFCGSCGAHVVMPDPMDSRIGERLLGRYVVTARLGEGAMGGVYRAEQRTRHLRRQVAIKVLHPEMSAERSLRARFLRECELIAGLRHPNTVRVFDMGELEDGCLALVMELIEGETLRERLERGPLSLAETMVVARGLLGALAEAHDQGIVHRDIKPDNIMLFTHVDGRLGVKLLDFGVAQAPTETSLTGHGELLGTPPYMSPEQLMGRRLDPRSDLYAVGITVHEMLTGRHPLGEANSVLAWVSLHLDAEPVAPGVPGLSEQARVALRRSLAKSRENRPACAREMAEAFAAPLVRTQSKATPARNAPSHALHAHPHPIVDLDPPRLPRRSGPALSLMLAAAVLIAFGTVFAGLVEHAPVARNDAAPVSTPLAAPPAPVEAL